MSDFIGVPHQGSDLLARDQSSINETIETSEQISIDPIDALAQEEAVEAITESTESKEQPLNLENEISEVSAIETPIIAASVRATDSATILIETNETHEANDKISQEVSQQVSKEVPQTAIINVATDTIKTDKEKALKDNTDIAYRDYIRKVARPIKTQEHKPVNNTLSYIGKFYKWFFKENPLVKTGVVILFFGFGFLLKLAAEHGVFPIEVRLLIAGVISIALFVVGWILRDKKREYALSLQGGGLGGLYFIIFSAAKIFNVLPDSKLSLLLMLIVCGIIIGLAIYQRSQTLAFIAILGGFIAPPLMSTGGSTYLQLITFYTLLTFTILALSIRYSWQFIQILGFGMFFGFSTMIGFSGSIFGKTLKYYEQSQFLGSIILVSINIFIFGIALLFLNRRHHERNQILFNGKYTYQFNTALLLGTPLVGFGILYLLLKPYEYGIAIASVILGLSYIAVGQLSRMITSISLASERFFFTTLGLGFLTLAIPLAYTMEVTAIIWAIEGSIFLLINHREIPRTSYTMGTGLVVFSALYTLTLFSGIDVGLLSRTSAGVVSLSTLSGALGAKISGSTLLINAIALFIGAWRWNVSPKSDFVGFLSRVVTNKITFSRGFLIGSHLFWLLGLIVFSAEKWLTFTIHGYDSSRFVLLGLLVMSGLIFLALRHYFKWRDLEYCESSFMGLSLVTSLGIIIWLRGELFATGVYNILWVMIIGWMGALIYNLSKTDHPAFKKISIFGFLWCLWIINQLIVSVIPTNYMMDTTAMIWAIEGALFFYMTRPVLKGVAFIVGSALTLISVIYIFVLYMIEPAFVSLLPLLINVVAIMIAAWHWEHRSDRFGSGFSEYLSGYTEQIKQFYLGLSTAIWLLAIVIIGGQSWMLMSNGLYDSLRFNWLAIGAVSGMLLIILRGKLHWQALLHIEYSLIVGGILLTLSLQFTPLSALIAAGIYNIAWIFVAGWMALLIFNLLKANHRDAQNMTVLAGLWVILVLNQFMMSAIEPAYLMAIEAIILLSLNHRLIQRGSRYLGTLFAFIAWLLYLGTHYDSDHLWLYHISLIILIVPSLFAFYLHDCKTDEKLASNPLFKTLLTKGLLIIIGIYLAMSVILLGEFITPDYKEGMILLLAIGAAWAIYGLSRTLNWARVNQLGHLLGLQLAAVTVWQIMTLYYAWNAQSGLIDQGAHLSYLGLIALGIGSYYALMRETIKAYREAVGDMIHLYLGSIIIGVFISTYLLLVNKIITVEPSVIALYIGALPLLVFGLITSRFESIRHYANNYIWLSYPVLAGNGLLVLAKFFSAPVTMFNFYLPILNPLELGIIINIALLGYYSLRYTQIISLDKINRVVKGQPIALYYAVIVLLTMSTARAFAVYFNIQWGLPMLWKNSNLQAALSIIWTLCAMYAIIRSQKIKSYEYWLAGAIPLGVVVVKLFLVDITNSGGLVRGILFIAIALMLIVLGYFAPMPPMRKKQNLDESK